MFGWGLYGQCGQRSTSDLLRPICISSLSGIQVLGAAAVLWHTVCIAGAGQVYAFGGNQFGWLSMGAEQAETSPKRLDAASLEGKHVKMVSCGARHKFDDDQILSWGWNKYGQLGLGDTMERNIPAQVSYRWLPTKKYCLWLVGHTNAGRDTNLSPKFLTRFKNSFGSDRDVLTGQGSRFFKAFINASSLKLCCLQLLILSGTILSLTADSRANCINFYTIDKNLSRCI
ncbi:hypothetical protein PTKIN_Ptkin15bG0041600 [Pterospermum kingtungense]